ncbi:MAG: SufS family cysteine desulfurase [Clostridia bacterium]|nr:SufS family cysteine desulfurase [Clostridia bacterium]
MNNFKKDFPLLASQDIVYLDSAATTQKPQCVIDAVNNFYKSFNSNIHSGVYTISEKATTAYEDARQKVASFINAGDPSQIIFTKGTTESTNLVASCFVQDLIKNGDKIVISIMEHHSNLVPWQQIAQQKHATLEYLYLNDNYEIDKKELNKIDKNTKFVAITMVSNVLGTVVDVKNIIKKAHSVGAVVLVDAAQAIAHKQIDVKDLDADFLAFSGHKIYAPLGIGVLFGKKQLLEKMRPYMFGGHMIEYVNEQSTTFAPLPNKFEAGTQNVGGAVGLAAALDYVNKIGYKQIETIESELVNYALSKINKLPYVKAYISPNKNSRSGVLSFNIVGLHPHDVATVLNTQNVCVRSGNHCAQPLLSYLGINSTVRASFAIYNTKEDVDKLVEAIEYTFDKFKKYLR